jgi:RsiW-degrading membrane proteinase PrsW (M82 family)
MSKEFKSLVRPLIVLFVLTTGLFIVFGSRMEAKKIDQNVVLAANLILFIVTLVNLYFQSKNLQNPNSAAVIRGVMAGTFIKLLVLAAAVIIYLVAAGEGRSINAVFVGMALYVIYTWLEVKISLKLKRP